LAGREGLDAADDERYRNSVWAGHEPNQEGRPVLERAFGLADDQPMVMMQNIFNRALWDQLWHQYLRINKYLRFAFMQVEHDWL
jgi:hypothetical protein